MNAMKRRLILYCWLSAGALLAIGVVVALLAVPAIIRSAYAGHSLDALNAVFAGRDAHPVEHYLDVWRALSWKLLLIALGITVIASFLIAFRTRIAALQTRLFGGSPAAGPGTGLLIALWLGIVMGFLEFGVVEIQRLIDHSIVEWGDDDRLWMLPLVKALLYPLFCVILAAVTGGWRRRVALRSWIWPLLTIGLFGSTRALELGIHPLALLALAAGTAHVLVTAATRHATGLLRTVRVTTGPLAVLVAALLVSMRLGPDLLESRAYARLPAARPDAPNILLIIWDTVRSANLSLYGYGRPTTPGLERLAARGVVFDNAISTAPWTLPGHASIFTGRYWGELSVDWRSPLDDTEPTIAEILSDHGYATAGFVANLLYTTKKSGLNRGFGHYSDFEIGTRELMTSGTVPEIIARFLGGGLGVDMNSRKLASDVNAEFLKWEVKQRRRPWFVFLNYMDAHTPYMMFENELKKFGGSRPDTLVPDSLGRFAARDSAGRDTQDRYDSTLATLDGAVTRLLDALRARGSLDNTVVIIASDHGEQFGEHDLYGHGSSLYLPVIHVPLLILPREAPATALRIPTPVTNRDLAATILDLAGLPDGAVPGQSLTGFWTGNPPLGRTSPVYAEAKQNPFLEKNGPVVFGPLWSILEDSLHYIQLGDGREQLYDIAHDPFEVVDRADSARYASDLARLRNESGRATTRSLAHRN